MFKRWIQYAGIRAIKTAAQTAAALIPAAVTICDVDWKVVLGTAALAAVASILTSVAGLPEMDVPTGLEFMEDSKAESEAE